jgi:hypothetical protein
MQYLIWRSMEGKTAIAHDGEELVVGRTMKFGSVVTVAEVINAPDQEQALIEFDRRNPQSTQNHELPRNTLLHTFGMYNAIVIASNGTRITWNNTLGFSLAEESAPWPIVDISDMRNIVAAVDKFIEDSKEIDR